MTCSKPSGAQLALLNIVLDKLWICGTPAAILILLWKNFSEYHTLCYSILFITYQCCVHVVFCCRTILDAWSSDSESETKCKWPVIVIDEANVLMGWDNNPTELKALLSYFVQMTKQANRCHVLMATSEYGYQAWINKGN